jgi:hypothetical protein
MRGRAGTTCPVMALLRHVGRRDDARLRGKTGSHGQTVRMTRMTRCGQPGEGETLRLRPTYGFSSPLLSPFGEIDSEELA